MLNTCPCCGGDWPFLAEACPSCSVQTFDELKVSLALVGLLLVLFGLTAWH